MAEGPEQEGILLRVVVSGVRQIAGKPARCRRVTFLAGGNDIGPAQMGAGIGHPQDVMRTMAVIALGGVGISQARDLAVIRLEIGLANLSVAATARVHDIELETSLIGAADGVSGVAVAADRKWLVGFRDRSRVHALHELLLDSVVADSAGGGHVLRVHGGIRIGARQDEVCSVATGAGGGHGQAALHQALAVNALTVVLNNLMLPSGVTHGGFLALAMATAAESGHIRIGR